MTQNVLTALHITLHKRTLTIPLMDHLISEMLAYFDPRQWCCDVFPSVRTFSLTSFLRRKPCTSCFAVLCRWPTTTPGFWCEAFPLAAQMVQCGSRSTATAQFKPWKNVTMNYFRLYTHWMWLKQTGQHDRSVGQRMKSMTFQSHWWVFCVYRQSHLNDFLVHCAD